MVSHTHGLWGAQMRFVEYIPALRDEGISPTLPAPREGPFVDAFREAGGQVRLVDLGERLGLRDANDDRPGVAALVGQARDVLATAYRLRPLLREFDVVQSHSRTAHLEVALAGRLALRPVVLDVHDVVRPGVGLRVLRLTGDLATTVLANSSSTALTLGPRQRKVRVINPAVDLTRFSGNIRCDSVLREKLGGSEGRTLIGVVGRVDRDKRIELLLEAVSLLERSDVDIAVVGASHIADEDYLHELAKRAAELLPDRVSFVGARSDMAEVMACLDVLASVCTVEAFGRSILEAQASRVRVVAPDLLGVSDIVEHESTGWLFAPEDSADLADVLDRLLSFPSVERVLATAYSQAQSLGHETQVRELIDLYRSVAVRGRR